jgi:hypothetical protein
VGRWAIGAGALVGEKGVLWGDGVGWWDGVVWWGQFGEECKERKR